MSLSALSVRETFVFLKSIQYPASQYPASQYPGEKQIIYLLKSLVCMTLTS